MKIIDEHSPTHIKGENDDIISEASNKISELSKPNKKI